jgi:hypothetical protein
MYGRRSIFLLFKKIVESLPKLEETINENRSKLNLKLSKNEQKQNFNFVEEICPGRVRAAKIYKNSILNANIVENSICDININSTDLTVQNFNKLTKNNNTEQESLEKEYKGKNSPVSKLIRRLTIRSPIKSPGVFLPEDVIDNSKKNVVEDPKMMKNLKTIFMNFKPNVY